MLLFELFNPSRRSSSAMAGQRGLIPRAGQSATWDGTGIIPAEMEDTGEWR
jgi:hypothetical protein